MNVITMDCSANEVFENRVFEYQGFKLLVVNVNGELLFDVEGVFKLFDLPVQDIQCFSGYTIKILRESQLKEFLVISENMIWQIISYYKLNQENFMVWLEREVLPWIDHDTDYSNFEELPIDGLEQIALNYLIAIRLRIELKQLNQIIADRNAISSLIQYHYGSKPLRKDFDKIADLIMNGDSIAIMVDYDTFVK